MSDPTAALRAISGAEPSDTAVGLPNIPAVPFTDDASLTNFLQSAKLWMEKAMGAGLTGFATKQDLIRNGLLGTDAKGNLVPTGGVPNLAIPPVPTGLTASGAMTIILLEWDDPRLAYSNHGYTEIWAAEVDNFSSAVLVGQGAGFIFSHAVGEDSTRYYWIRFVSTSGIKGPYNSVNGTIGQTAKNPGYLLDTLTGQLTESQLYADLNSRIDLIDGPATMTNSAAWRVLQEANARQAAISTEATTRQTADDSLASQITTLTASVNANASAIQTEATTRANADSAEATARTTLAARVTTVEGDVATNAAAIQSEATTRANQDSALSSQISTVSAAASKTRTYSQTTAPTTGMVTGDLWFDTDDDKKLYRYNGSSWVATDDARLAANAADIKTEATARANGDSANATLINQVQARLDTGDYAAVKTESSANASAITGIQAKYSVKVDANGYVSGFGLISTANNATPYSEFAIVADKFSIAPVATSYSAADGSPFFYLTTPTTINGVSVPAGAYMKSAYIHDAAITNAKIADLSADKITTGTLAADRIGANSITADKINGTNLQVVNGTFSGSLQAATGTFTGSLSAATGTFSGRLTAGTIDPGAFAGIVQTYSTPGTYTVTVPTGTGWSAINMRATLQGAGGGGGGGAASANEIKGASGGGGGAGSAINVTLNNLAPGATYTLVVGAGGAGGPFSSIGQPGGSGGATSLAGYSAPGGGGGGGGNPYGGGSAGAGGSIGGTSGSVGPEYSLPFLPGGRGGSSAYGAGGGPDAGGGVGAGGGGGSAGAGDVDRGGAPGGGGMAIIEFYDPNAVVTNTRYSNLIAWLDGVGHGAVPANAR